MTPKRDPRSTPKRSKIDIKFDINFDGNVKGRGTGLALVVWGRDPPLGAPGMRPRGPGEAAQASRDRPPRHSGTHVRVLNMKISKNQSYRAIEL